MQLQRKPSTTTAKTQYASHQTVDKIQGHSVKKATSLPWFLIVADEAIDVVNRNQLNLSIHWVSDDYKVHTDSIALYRMPDTKAGIDEM